MGGWEEGWREMGGGRKDGGGWKEGRSGKRVGGKWGVRENEGVRAVLVSVNMRNTSQEEEE